MSTTVWVEIVDGEFGPLFNPKNNQNETLHRRVCRYRAIMREYTRRAELATHEFNQWRRRWDSLNNKGKLIELTGLTGQLSEIDCNVQFFKNRITNDLISRRRDAREGANFYASQISIELKMSELGEGWPAWANLAPHKQ